MNKLSLYNLPKDILVKLICEIQDQNKKQIYENFSNHIDNSTRLGDKIFIDTCKKVIFCLIFQGIFPTNIYTSLKINNMCITFYLKDRPIRMNLTTFEEEPLYFSVVQMESPNNIKKMIIEGTGINNLFDWIRSL